MGKIHDAISPQHAEFIAVQPVFFVATAAASTEQRVNVSPRAPGKSCVVTGPHQVAVADLSGSGCETAAHVLENGRLTLLFVNLLEGPPQMLRLHGYAKLKLPEEVDDALLARFPEKITSSPGFRCVYILNVDRVSTSCGYSMPEMSLERFRTILDEKSEQTDMHAYRTLKNCYSIDGIPSLMLLRLKDTVGPKPQNGYIYSTPLGTFDLAAKAKAQKRLQQIETSNARDFTNSRRPEKISLPPPTRSTFPVDPLSFFLGVLFCFVCHSFIASFSPE
ncbi:hypothetical protein CTAYLR_005106 [Chrysophaeum taylorii]|uniref:Pyridoxamine 5'-phosphate oxidase N-terminal domain-containing protein n=1 Tax=Chrysophaeum taylorii TaxID=2483200 RepID=A0AAD7UET9_9STRA|nr:hypothetical protein CTAYLR_005106 [Chrysophaeum taylorii]